MCLSTTSPTFGKFFFAIAKVEPIFFLETHAEALNESYPEKKLFLALVALGKARIPSKDRDLIQSGSEIVQCLRQDLRKLLDLNQYVLSFILLSTRDRCHFLQYFTVWYHSRPQQRFFTLSEDTPYSGRGHLWNRYRKHIGNYLLPLHLCPHQFWPRTNKFQKHATIRRSCSIDMCRMVSWTRMVDTAVVYKVAALPSTTQAVQSVCGVRDVHSIFG